MGSGESVPNKPLTLSGVIRANRPAALLKIGVSIANDSRESIHANRVANRPCH